MLLLLLACTPTPVEPAWLDGDGNPFDAAAFTPLDKTAGTAQLLVRAQGPGELKVLFEAGMPKCPRCEKACVDEYERDKWWRRFQLDAGPQVVNVGETVPDWRFTELWVSASLDEQPILPSMKLDTKWCTDPK